ncbi:MAG: hypothetical protein ACE5QV_03420 [Fidelibacterota bacterium]
MTFIEIIGIILFLGILILILINSNSEDSIPKKSNDKLAGKGQKFKKE